MRCVLPGPQNQTLARKKSQVYLGRSKKKIFEHFDHTNLSCEPTRLMGNFSSVFFTVSGHSLQTALPVVKASQPFPGMGDREGVSHNDDKKNSVQHRLTTCLNSLKDPK
ncbi:hypothetical protein RUM44_003501 [Polyplax serrata]|uniref:Uncharacterized protein n=1 Tax=Polyplax serrata TaxID=468196 RepID=A0ABR1AI27_POLSC